MVEQTLDQIWPSSQDLTIKRIFLAVITSILPSLFFWFLIFEVGLKPHFYGKPFRIRKPASKGSVSDLGALFFWGLLFLVVVILLGLFMLPAYFLSVSLPFKAINNSMSEKNKSSNEEIF
ncbi:MAG: hypothetical protein ACW986_18980 [Promethearchaeota archaeon]|jgi:hypothetical protein